MKEELILPYKLEQHLVEICNSNPIYANLLSVWNINKKMCLDVLNTIVMNYPHYTKHDISHCEAIITNIEMLLGEEIIKLLSPTDTWLLLHAAYLHDIGMVIECKKIEKNWDTKEFQDYLHELENSNDDTLARNARFINSLGDKLSKKENVMSWPVRVRYAVTLLIADYYRRQHAEESNDYITDMGRVFHIDLGFNGLIQQRLIMLLADIVCLHTESSKKILDLDYRTNGFNSDYAHPRFLAQMLRMGDLLDADNNRFNVANEVVFGEIPESSKNHWEKHMSARHILVTPDVIEYRADCGKIEVYRETRVFISWLKEEVEFWALNWKNIMPANIKGSAPRLGKCELLLKGVPDIQGISDLRFSISPEKAFEVIEGSNIYEDKFVFLREVVQNALDACKVQLWRDISEERYRSWITHEHDGEIQPFEINKEVFNNYKVEVRLCYYDSNHFKIIIKDNGTGLSAEQFKNICNVGVSYLGDRKRKEEIESMPLWLRPTAGFGIGLQSIFLVADEFEIYSKTSIGEGICVRVESRRKNGYVQINKSKKVKSQGTEVHIILSRDMDFKYGGVSNTQRYVQGKYDPFVSEKNLLYYKLWDVLRDTIESTYFPVELYFDNTLVDTIEEQKFVELKKHVANNRYCIKKLENYGMELWDYQTCTRIKMKLLNTYQLTRGRYFFKGMALKVEPRFDVKGVVFSVDFYGLDTKKTLTLDRKRIRKESLKGIHEILDSAIQFYLSEVEKELFAEKDNREEGEYNLIYTYWCMVSPEKKQELLQKYNIIFEKVTREVDVLIKNSDNIFEKNKMDFKSIIEDLDHVATIRNFSKFTSYKSGVEAVNIELIKSIIDRKDILFSKIIVEKEFSEILTTFIYDKMQVVLGINKNIYLASHTSENKKLLELADDDTKRFLICRLLEEMDSPLYGGGFNSSLRRHMVGLEEYKRLCTTNVPFGIDGEIYRSNGYIISPITIEQWKKYKHMDVDEFINSVCMNTEFQNLLNHVYMNQFKVNKYTKVEIEEEYIKFIRDVYNNMN